MMAERTSVTQLVQIGPETTPGTLVPADTLLPSLQVATSIDGSWTKVNASGYKVPTNVAIGKEWTTAKVSAEPPTFDELPYLFCGLLKSVTPTIDDTAQVWNWVPSSTNPEQPKSFTIEQGDSVRAHRFTYGVLTELTFTGDRDKVSLDGQMIGQLFEDGITLTAGATPVQQVPVLPRDVTVYLDNAGAGIGTTKLGRVLSWEYGIKDVNAPLWVVDATADSWTALVNTPITGQFKVKLEADAEGMALLSAMRSGARKFIRIECISSVLAGGSTPFSLTLDAAGQIATKPSEIGDQDGVYAIEFTFDMTHDGTWGKFADISVTNGLAAL